MGLDQHLYRTTYTLPSNTKRSYEISVKHPDEKYNMPKIDASNIAYTMEEVMYWRKANHIHKWFVDNIQGGIDNCATYTVYSYDLEKLLNLCKQVLANPDKAEELLPTQSGCFFGVLEYNEYYFESIKNTIEVLEKIIPTVDDFNSWFEYSSSW